MSGNLILFCGALMLLCACGNVEQNDAPRVPAENPKGALCGAYGTAQESLTSEARRAFDVLCAEQRFEKVEFVSFSQQVVAGMNYRFVFNVLDAEGKSIPHTAVVWAKLDGSYVVTACEAASAAR